MSEIEEYQDKIDEYIRGTMSVSDRIIFEGEVRQNAELRQEVEVQTSISDAVQAVHLKQLLQQIEADMAQANEESPIATDINGEANPVIVVRPNVFRRQLSYWASAVAAVMIIFFSGNSWRQTQRYKGFGNDYYSALVEPVVRDGNELDKLLSSSYTLIGAGDYDAAVSYLNEARKQIDNGLALPIVDEESEYEHEILLEKLYDVDWYEAIILMRQGKCRKAKEALRNIATSDSPYARNAKNILK